MRPVIPYPERRSVRAVPESRILSAEVIGLTDDAVKQVRQANYGVCTGAMTVDEAIVGYGSFTD